MNDFQIAEWLNKIGYLSVRGRILKDIKVSFIKNI